MDDSGSTAADAAEQPPTEPVAPTPGGQVPRMVRTRAVPTSTLVLGTILLVVAGFLGGWIVGHHAAHRSDQIAFASFIRHREGGFYGPISGCRPGIGSGYGPGFEPGTTYCGPCYATSSGASMPCSSGMPGYPPGVTGPIPPVPTAVPGSGGAQGSSGSQGSGS